MVLDILLLGEACDLVHGTEYMVLPRRQAAALFR